jgi:membrane protein
MIVAQRLPRPLRHSFTVITSQPPVRFVLALAKRISADDIPGLAAEMAYRFLFALFPFLIFVAALVGFIGARIGSDNLFATVMGLVSTLFPGEIQELLSNWISGVLQKQSTSLLTLGAAGALYGAAGGVGTLIKGLNRAHEVTETRPFWTTQAMALLTTLALAVLMIGGVLLYTLGEWLGDFLAARFGLGEAFRAVWGVLRGPGVAVGLALSLLGLYRLLPNADIRVSHAIPGAIFATLAWVVLTLGFSFYLAHFGSYDRTFGSLGTAVVLMVWMYFVGMILLIGGEINALIAASTKDTSAGYDARAGMNHLLEELGEKKAS